jgi:hypothetical protein
LRGSADHSVDIDIELNMALTRQISRLHGLISEQEVAAPALPVEGITQDQYRQGDKSDAER